MVPVIRLECISFGNDLIFPLQNLKNFINLLRKLRKRTKENIRDKEKGKGNLIKSDR